MKQNKRAKLYGLLKQKHIDVVMLQETHSDISNAADWVKEWDGDIVRSLKALEIEIVELLRLEATGDRGHIEALKTVSGQGHKQWRTASSWACQSSLSERPESWTGELSLEELHEALQRMENGRASGIDSLQAEFYKAFWAVIGQDVLDVLRDSIRRGELPLSCRRAVLTLLPKKGDPTHLKNWCPVSLLCTDCKLLSKALDSRLTKVMERLIHQDQTYCVPDRSIFDNVYLVRDILDVSRLLGLKTGLIFLDQEKAFDRVEHEYLWKVLEAFGFNPGFVAMIRVLYSEIESVLKILSSAKVNWTKSKAILVGEWGGGQPSLPGGLAWKRGGFTYLGVYLGTIEFLNKNWEGSVEHVKGRLSRWKRLVPKMSYRGRTLVINNLAASSLWHKLACIDPPPNLLANIQAQLVDYFWDGLHWIPQSILHLPKEEGGQGLVQLSSRASSLDPET
ncbi:hypothetical protein QTP86_004494 [Hemibagrus guttatus]|nr:hypothetical protein QTP86_004494 [Hemibagrus guttatus]